MQTFDINKAISASTDAELKSAILKKQPIIISNNKKLYSKLMKTFPIERVSKMLFAEGVFFTSTAIFILIATLGSFYYIAIPQIILGIVLTIIGYILDDYKHYDISMNFTNKTVIFIKSKGKTYIKRKDRKRIIKILKTPED